MHRAGLSTCSAWFFTRQELRDDLYRAHILM